MIIGLTGKKQAGKSTVAKYLVDHHNFIEYSVAFPLKQIAKIMCGFTEQQVNGTEQDKETIDENIGISPREFLQVFGTEICRDTLKKHFPNMNLGDSGTIWVYLLEQFIQKNKDKDIVISDIRFQDEARVIKQSGGILIQIVRQNTRRLIKDSHASENQSIAADHTLFNFGLKQELFEKVEKLINNYVSESEDDFPGDNHVQEHFERMKKKCLKK